eukprot:1620610-Rhodomonas_salina.1
MVVALIPASRLRAGWRVEKTYSNSARVFVRPVGAGRVYCKGSGFSWVMVLFGGAAGCSPPRLSPHPSRWSRGASSSGARR